LPVQESWRQRYAAGRFAKIKATDGQHITLREKDDATIAYLVPSAGIDGLVDLNELARMIEELPPVSHSRGCDGVEARGVDDVRFYCVWNPMTPGLEPLESCNFRRDGASAEEFVNAAKPLWDYADGVMKNVFAGCYRFCAQYPLPDCLQRKAGPWMGMAINRGTIEPVCCKEHRDVLSAMYGVSCLCPLGNYEGGNVILWELQVEVELRPGDLLFFPDHLITHSNSSAVGIRHSLVAFMRQAMMIWLRKRYRYMDEREESGKIRRKERRVIAKRKGGLPSFNDIKQKETKIIMKKASQRK